MELDVEQFDQMVIMEICKLRNVNVDMMPVNYEKVRWNQIAQSAMCHSLHQSTVCVLAILVTIHMNPTTASNVFDDHKNAVSAQA